MRFGTWRGVTVAIALVAGLVSSTSVRANDPFHHTIPKEVDAIDVNTGGPYFAPPIPYGHYNKTSHLHKGLGLATGSMYGLFGKLHALKGLCHGCGGKGCGFCGGTGRLGGHGGDLGHGGHGHGGAGLGQGGGCIGEGCGGLAGLGHGKRFKGCGLCGGKGCGVCQSEIFPSAQVTSASAQSAVGCGVKGCGLGHGHKHGGLAQGSGCNHGRGASCGNCAGVMGRGGLGHGGAGSGVGNSGCGACGGKGCGSCLGGLGRGGLCKGCGGAGCALCGKLKGALGMGKGLVYGLLHPHAGKIEYFVGPGGPVPITPGYVPYVVTTRSPRDFLAFPPFTP